MSLSFFHCQTHTVPGQHIRHYAHSTAHDQHATFYIHVKQYTPRDNLKPQAGDVTIIATHASGVPKEAYEPVWDELLASSRRGCKYKIRNIFTVDCHNQGASGRLNKDIMGDERKKKASTRLLLLYDDGPTNLV